MFLLLHTNAAIFYFKLLVGLWRWSIDLQSKIWLRLISLGENIQQHHCEDLSDS